MKRLLIGLGILIVLLAGTYFIVENINKRERIYRDGVRMEEYREESRYGYSFQFPAQYDLLEYGFENVSIGTRTEGGIDAVAEVVIHTAATTTEYASFEDFVYGESRLACAADSPTETINCTEVEQVQPFTTGTGLSGAIFYLAETRRNLSTGTTARSGKGPFIAFNLSAHVPEYQYTALVVRPPVVLAPDAVDTELLRDIADTLELIPVEERSAE